jgi:3-methyladenine DNA glycosylase AlkC
MAKPSQPRKGAIRMADIPADILAQLSIGAIETLTLPEWLAVNHKTLIQTLAPDISDELLAPLAAGNSIMARSRHAGLALLEIYGPNAVDRFQSHPSDTVRGWVCFSLAGLPNQTLSQRIKAFTTFADDSHFGVRELAWIALRPHLTTDLPKAVSLLAKWTDSPKENLRRFASEITRPRGVWCQHIDALKSDPGLALPILQPLRADPSRYVQNSVANWINDASKTRPDWARELTGRWAKESPTPATAYIIKRAMRSLDKGLRPDDTAKSAPKR